MKKGEKMSPEQRLLISKNRKGKNLNNKHTLGKKHRLETILKMKEWHIKSWAHYPDFRFDVSNGVTLCKECHKLTNNYKGKGNKKI